MGCSIVRSCSGETIYVNPAPKSPLDVLTPRRILRTRSILRSMARLLDRKWGDCFGDAALVSWFCPTNGLFLGLASAVWPHWNLFRFGSAVLRFRTLVAWNTYWFRSGFSHHILRMSECLYHNGLPTIWECGACLQNRAFMAAIRWPPRRRPPTGISFLWDRGKMARGQPPLWVAGVGVVSGPPQP